MPGEISKSKGGLSTLTPLTAVARAKNFFFDKAIVRESMSGVAYRAAMSFGAYTRTVAINSMKRGKIRARGKNKGQQIHSKPGQPPRYWKGLIRRFLYFAFDTRTHSVVIGPIQLGARSTVLRDLELGKSSKGLAARPYMQPAFEKSKKRLNSQIARAGFKKALKEKM